MNLGNTRAPESPRGGRSRRRFRSRSRSFSRRRSLSRPRTRGVTNFSSQHQSKHQPGSLRRERPSRSQSPSRELHDKEGWSSKTQTQRNRRHALSRHGDRLDHDKRERSRRYRRNVEDVARASDSDAAPDVSKDIDGIHGVTRKTHLRRRKRSLSISSVDSNTLVQSVQQLTQAKEAQKQAVDEEVTRRVELEVERRVQQVLHSDQFQRETQERLNAERARLEAEMKAELEREKRKILDEFRRQEVEKKQKSQQLEDILAENERKIKEQQRRLAEEQAKRDEERLIELQRRQQQMEEENRRRRVQELELAKQDAQAKAKKPKMSFKLGQAESVM